MALRILSWNIQNLGQAKLLKSLSYDQSAAGVGNNVLGYITKVVTGNSAWSALPELATPFDVIVIIELTSGGKKKGAPATGSGLNALKDITVQVNATLGTGTKYKYAPPLNIGKESVGVIFDSSKLVYKSGSVLRDGDNNYLLPRTVYMAEFLNPAGTKALNVAGVHAPPTNAGDSNVKWRDPVNYCINMATITDLIMSVPTVAVMGDFNCNPDTVYNNGMVDKKPFTDLEAQKYETSIPNGTLTSMKTPGTATKASYRANAYDNFFYLRSTPTSSNVVDLIKGNPIFATDFDDVVENYWLVSDHLPVYAEVTF